MTRTQDGAYTISRGTIIENASGGDAADTIIGNEYDNVLNSHKGADTLYGGHGDDILKGGKGDDSLVAGRGHNRLDGGADFDTASYRDYYDPHVGVPFNQGINISITADQVQVTKPLNGAIAGPVGASLEIDKVKNVERFEGTARDDIFTVENLSGNMYLSGGAGDNSLTIKDPAGAYSLDMTAGKYPAGDPQAGEAYSGKVSDGTHTIYLEDGFKSSDVTIEKPFEPPIPTPRPTPSLTPLPTSRPTPSLTPLPTPRPMPATDVPLKTQAEMSLKDAVETLAEDQQTLNAQFNTTGVSSQARDAINHGDALQMIKNLDDHGISSLKAELTAGMDIEDRVGAILNAGAQATIEAGLLMPEEERHLGTQADAASNAHAQTVERGHDDDYSYGA